MIAKLAGVARPRQDAHIAGVSASGIPARCDAVVVGAGPAGLATSRELARRGIVHVVLERGDRPAHTWANLYDSLTLHTGRHLSGLPGCPLPPGTPLFPTRGQFVEYLRDYVRRFALPVRTGITVGAARPEDGHWHVATSAGDVRARYLVMATGIVSNPVVPTIPGRETFTGSVFHSCAYRRPADVAGDRVLLVGTGNSAGEIATELARVGYTVDVAVRSGAHVVPREIAGIPIQYLALGLQRLPGRLRERVALAVRSLVELRRGPSPLPRPSTGLLDSVPLIGLHFVDEIRAGNISIRPGVATFTAAGMRFTDGSEHQYDTVILATGYRAALGPLGDLVRRDSRGFALRTDRVTSADQPRLWFVGHNYDTTGGLFNIARDAPLVGAALER